MSFSSIPSWLKGAGESILRGRHESRPGRRPKRTCRPGLEVLEGRDVPATTFTVTNLNDAGLGRLRQAIIDANNLAGPDAIVFQPGLTGAITLTTGQLTVTGPVTITGPGSGALTISGNNASRIFLIDDGTDAVQDVTITGLALTQGKVTGAFQVGGAIKVANENLSLNDMAIINNTAEGGGGGIAVGRTGRLTLENSTVSGNTVTSDGGGLFLDGLSVATIRNSTIVLNKTTGSGQGGGGIHVESDGFLTIDRSTIAGNETVLSGGGIDVFSGTLIVRNSTISGNSAGTGGGILFGGGSLTVENSTISGNSSKFDGGGIWMRGTTAAIRNSTIAFNTADSDNNGNGTQRGGIFVFEIVPPPSALTLQSTLVAENFRGTGGTLEDVVGTVVGTSANNLIGVDTGLTGITNGILGNLIGTAAAPINPLLAPLANNGGPTQTHALLAGSPAINAGFNFSGSAADQRGGAFSRSVGPTDIGAFEVQPPKPPITARHLVVSLEIVKKNHHRRFIIVVRFADTGEIKAQFNSPFNKPGFRKISVSLLDQNGDGVGDAVQVTALKAGPGKRLLTRILGF
jgi:parallel beta-helix repeat protein